MIRKFIAFATVQIFVLAGCANFSADAALLRQKLNQNASGIAQFCNNEVLPVANSPEIKALLLVADTLPYGADFTLAQKAAVATCQDLETVSKSLTTLPWLKSQLPVIVGKGKVAPPAVIAPAPVTATSVIPGV